VTDDGWVKLYRKSVGSQVFQNAGLWKAWSWCLMKANHAEAWVPVKTGRGSTEVHLMPGQFIFGRKTAAKELKMKEPTVQKRMLKLKSMGNLVSQSSRHYSVVTVANWEFYQGTEEKVSPKLLGDEPESRAQSYSSKSAENGSPNDPAKGASDKEISGTGVKGVSAKYQPSITNKNEKKIDIYILAARKVLSYLNELSSRDFTYSNANIRVIVARLREGHTIDECKQVIQRKWRDPDFNKKYFRPSTLFGASKFEGYLNEEPRRRWDEA
jgi:uncharacterized phage protein (TIGR02220 family)